MANESKGMDEILGSNVSKGYGGIGKFVNDNIILPSLGQVESGAKSATFANRDLNNGRPMSQDK